MSTQRRYPARMSPVRVAETLRRMDECMAELDRPHSDDELRAAARKIGAEDYLPDPQDELELR